MSEPELKTRLLATLRGQISAPTPIGERLLVFNVDSAEISGPRLNARVVAPSGDWIKIQANGNWQLDVRLLFETDSGDHIFCYYTGRLRADAQLSGRIANGERIPGEEMYFRSTPYFETSAANYLWLNDIVCVGTMREFGGGEAVYDLFEVL
ncbi:MAG: DUF3237 domain-containing protein [Halieaceae bacterium]|jgi:hypothetical protein|nr:DUF3237 domain-containing protein [Halieaceae bacterium]